MADSNTGGIDAMKHTAWIGNLESKCVDNEDKTVCEAAGNCKNTFTNTLYQSTDFHAQW